MRKLAIASALIGAFLNFSGSNAQETALPSLNKNSSNFEGYYYEIYQFSSKSAQGGFVSVHSKIFDSHLILIDPNGVVSSNSSYSYGTLSSRVRSHLKALPGVRWSDAALPLKAKSAGQWTAIVTTARRSETGSFTLRHQGIENLRRLDSATFDRKQLERAFAARGVITEAARRKRAEEDRRRRIGELVEKISLRVYRVELRQKLQSNLRSQTAQAGRNATRHRTLAQREAKLSDALVEIAVIKRNKDFVRSVLLRDLESTRASARGAAESQLRSVKSREALLAALSLLTELDSLSAKLEKAEADMLKADSPDKLMAARATYLDLRSAWTRLSQEISAKLIDSGLLRLLRFGSLRGNTNIAADKRYSAKRRARRLQSRGSSIGSVLGAGVAALDASSPGARDSRFDASPWLPSLLPWPPPDASARAVISRRLLVEGNPGAKNLADADSVLRKALSDAGYHEVGYFGVPSGFAMVTRIEQTDAAGTPLTATARWSTKIEAIKSFSILGVLRALLTAPAGYFRVVALVISDKPFTQSGARARLSTVERWARKGLNVLPSSVGVSPLTDKHRVTALVYEFEKSAVGEQPNAKVPGRLSAATHLAHTRFADFML